MRYWLFASPIQTSYGPGVRFRAPRPGEEGPQDDRWHCGIDIEAVEGALILAPEDCTIIDGNRGWEGTAKATLVHTASGYSLLFGCTAPDSSPPEGTKVPRGGVLAAIGYYTTKKGNHSSMLHFQVYEGLRTAAQVTATQSWKQGNPKPANLIDPEIYLEGMVPQDGTTPDTPQIPTPPGPAVQADRHSDKDPCTWVDGKLVCQVGDVDAWQAALRTYHAASIAAYLAAKAIVDGGKAKWNPTTSGAYETNSSNSLAISDIDNSTHETDILDGLPQDQVLRLVARCQRAVEARDVFLAVKPGGEVPAKPPNPGPIPGDIPASGGSGGGGAIAAGAAAVVAIGVGVAVVASKRRRRR